LVENSCNCDVWPSIPVGEMVTIETVTIVMIVLRVLETNAYCFQSSVKKLLRDLSV